MLIFVYEMGTTRPDSYVCHETGLNAISTSGHASKAHSAVSDLPQRLQKKSHPRGKCYKVTALSQFFLNGLPVGFPLRTKKVCTEAPSARLSSRALAVLGWGLR